MKFIGEFILLIPFKKDFMGEKAIKLFKKNLYFPDVYKTLLFT